MVKLGIDKRLRSCKNLTALFSNSTCILIKDMRGVENDKFSRKKPYWQTYKVLLRLIGSC